ncbi:LytR/AlgR family response regulator transcription factor [Tenacibaculum sp. M341]|uniref:LytR/AlgR family response regulator transcription factor n=1 Tax=Tenacibaculum sp. M341 TaxID=2530339 RepID=UPI0010436AD3|nr:LytTR family DNA-binding domain-containing protein [Tenacibaculum sp. M341]TCI84882.1 response regulator transcription factor [Tenacibaculum sp. M341]
MNTINVVIIDDEFIVSETLKSYIEEYTPNLNILSVINKPNDAKEIISKLKPDLIFLDIQMPILNGFELLKSFEEINFDIIFTTAYNNYAIEAFKVNAFDYLLKPINVNELQNTIHRYYLKKKNNPLFQYGQVKSLLEKINTPNKTERITVPEIGGLTILQTSEIICLKSDYGYTDIYCKNGSKITSSKALKHFCSLLKNHPDFYEIGKSGIINLNYISKYYNEGTIILENNIKVSVPRRSRKAFLETLQIQ